MANPAILDSLRRHEIPGRVAVAVGNGGFPKIEITSDGSAAEIYPHGAHITHFQKKGEPPLLFLSRKSWFAPGQPIRGGVPICFPWFGASEGGPSHGLARITEWQLVKTAAANGAVTLTFALPQNFGGETWQNLRTDFVVTIADTLTMELTTMNETCDETLEIENCLHSYFHVGDIEAVGITGLEGAAYDDYASGATGLRRTETGPVLRVTQETNRTYPGHTGPVEIRDEKLGRTIRVEKFNSRSTVVWNPWTTQKLPDDFDPAEHRQMVCVETGNVKQDKILLAPGKTADLKAVVSSR
jgi:glucose-6-phosphate 1-epimerase